MIHKGTHGTKEISKNNLIKVSSGLVLLDAFGYLFTKFGEKIEKNIFINFLLLSVVGI